MVNHINFAIVPKTHPPMYFMHKYWARKPHNVVAEYIEHYSNKDEIVLDPFAGSGVTAIEAIKKGRKAIAIDLDPMASFITRMTAMPVDTEKLKDEFKKLKNNLKSQINEFYKTTCMKCKNVNAIISHVVWKKESDNSETPIEEWYHCSCSKDILKKKPDKNDLKRIDKYNSSKISHWYPSNELVWNSRVNVSKGEKIRDLFTTRNLIAISLLYDYVSKIQDKNIQDIFKFTFTGFIVKSSRLNFVNVGGYRSLGRGWAIRGYWIPPEHMEQNVWNDFEAQFEEVLKGKENSIKEIKTFKEAKSFSDLKNDNILIKNFNTLELEKILPPNSVDYIFTDPPYWDAVPYLELDYLWSSWLNFKPNFEDEIIVSDAPERNKSEEMYKRMLTAAFQQIFRVLKPGKWMTVTFHNTNIQAWNSIIQSCILAGFDLEKIVYQPPAKPSAKGLLAPYGSAIGDYYMRFRKPEKSIEINASQTNEETFKRIVLDAAKKIIAERGEPTPYTFILNGIIVKLKKEGALLLGSQNPDEIMKEFIDKEFVLVNATDEKGNVVGKKWWFKDPSSIPYLELVPLADRVEVAIVDVLRRKIKVSFDDILQEIFIKFPNALTPETQDIREVLQEYANPTKGRQWILKDNVRVRQSEHSEILYYLALIGKKLGFDIWIGLREQGEAFNNVRLSSFIKNLNSIWKTLTAEQTERVKQIDMLWCKKNGIEIEFEVENTTAITEAIVRGSNIENNEIKRIIVIPEEREGLLFRKMKEPMFTDNIKKYKWRFIFYKDVKSLFDKSKTVRKFGLEEVLKLFKTPKSAKVMQDSIKTYLKKR